MNQRARIVGVVVLLLAIIITDISTGWLRGLLHDAGLIALQPEPNLTPVAVDAATCVTNNTAGNLQISPRPGTAEQSCRVEIGGIPAIDRDWTLSTTIRPDGSLATGRASAALRVQVNEPTAVLTASCGLQQVPGAMQAVLEVGRSGIAQDFACPDTGVDTRPGDGRCELASVVLADNLPPGEVYTVELTTDPVGTATFTCRVAGAGIDENADVFVELGTSGVLRDPEATRFEQFIAADYDAGANATFTVGRTVVDS